MRLETDRAVREPNFNSLTGKFDMHCVRSCRIYQKGDCSSRLSVFDTNKSPPPPVVLCIATTLRCCRGTLGSKEVLAFTI
jgi:hypothetical protein